MYELGWEFKVCSFCLKNAHEKVIMVKQKIEGKEVWVCPKCGSLRTY